MKRMLGILTLAACAAGLVARPAAAQTFDAAGTRAAGMGGAFVAIADDASAAYWNPAGFASGSYFSLVLDSSSARTEPAGELAAGSRSSFLMALGAPPLGLSYYRLRATVVEPAAIPTDTATADRNLTGADVVRVRSLVTHHAGATLVQSIVPGVAVGGTLKLVRGIAASSIRPGGDADSLLDDHSDLVGQASTKFDADLGIMASAGRVKAGLTVRNVMQPQFETAGGGAPIALERQARAGVAISPLDGWAIAADLDLTMTAGPRGQVRDFALGAEGRVVKRLFVRSGTRFNTVEGEDRAPSVAFGGGYAVKGSVLLDAQVTLGSDRAPKGWGVSARFVY